jgi:hypothetical protein
MKLASIEAIIRALEDSGVRYLVAGGVAVNAHGYLRFTQDMDLVISLDPTNIVRAFDALAKLGYKPLVPITAEQFSNAQLRRSWIREKGMQVLNLASDRYRDTTVDIFVTEPFDFDTEHRAAFEDELAPGLTMKFVSIRTLIAMKEAANRPRDVDDIQHLRWILEDKSKR